MSKQLQWFFLVGCLLSFNLQAQTFKYRLTDSLSFLDDNGIPYPKGHSGGFQAPQFSPCDVNGDNKKDMVVYDRIDGSISTFLNIGGVGEVKYVSDNRYAAYFPKLSPNAWMLMRDYNADGYEDIFTTDPTGRVQVYKNISFTVSGKPAFDKIPQLYFRNISPNGSFIEYNILSMPFIHVPGIYDIDFDGDIDIMSYSNLGGAIEVYKNMQAEFGLPPDSIRYRNVDLCWAFFTDNNCNTFTLNTCTDTNYYKFYWKRHTSGSAITLFDADNDKDIDMVLGNEGCDHMTMLINGKSDYNSLYDTIIRYDTNFVSASNRAKIWLYPAGYFMDIDNDGKRDFIYAPNSNSYPIQETKQVFWFKNTGLDLAPVFAQKQPLFTEEIMDVGNRSSWACADLDKDGDLDCLCANNADSAYLGVLYDRVYLYENTGTASKPSFKLKNRNFANLASQKINSLTLSLADMDNDGKIDLVTGNDRGEIKYYKNTSSTNNTLTPTFLLSNNAFPGFNIDVGFYSWPAVADINKDGMNDLVIGHSDTFLKYYQNIGTKTNPDFNFVTKNFGYASPKDSFNFDYIHGYEYDTLGNIIKDSIIGIKVYYESTIFSSPQIMDINGDKQLELLVGNTVGHMKLYAINSASVNTRFVEYKDFYYYKLLQNQRITSFDIGNRISPVLANLEGDSVPEILVGINRGGIQYFRPDFIYSKGSGLIHLLVAELLSIYPNPTVNECFAEIDFNNVKSVKLITVAGQIFTPSYADAGGNKIVLDLNGLSTGIYFINIETTDGKIKVAKLSIQR
ncbi:MAG: FG-GAP-like repeat-containing protein [Bacteroidota bacterium]